MSREAALEALGYSLEFAPPPAALYRPVQISGHQAWVSGALPLVAPGQLSAVGLVGQDLTLEQAQAAAEVCAANVLRLIHRELGSLDKLVRVIRLGVYVASAPGFTDQHLVANGASALLVKLLGEAGQHARTTLGVAALPLGAGVEVDALLEIAV